MRRRSGRQGNSRPASSESMSWRLLSFCKSRHIQSPAPRRLRLKAGGPDLFLRNGLQYPPVPVRRAEAEALAAVGDDCAIIH